MRPILRKGDEGKEVQGLQELLWENGFVGADNPFWYSSVAKKYRITSPEDEKAKRFWVDGDFGSWTLAAVIDAQQRLIGPHKVPLDEVTQPGVVDLDTWWALEHITPDEQNQGIVEDASNVVTDGLGHAISNVWDHYIGLKVREIPNGSNRGLMLVHIGQEWIMVVLMHGQGIILLKRLRGLHGVVMVVVVLNMKRMEWSMEKVLMFILKSGLGYVMEI